MGNYTRLFLVEPKGIETNIQKLSKEKLDEECIDLFDSEFKTSRGDYVGHIAKYSKKHKINIKVIEVSEDFERLINIDIKGNVVFEKLFKRYVTESDLKKLPDVFWDDRLDFYS